jgi:uncharacterized protein (TIGR03663 family)
VITLDEQNASKLDGILDRNFQIKPEILIYVLLIVVAIFTRFYDLETRVMSHDESLHTYYSWRFKEFQDYQHSPLMHGPLQFHFVAFSYFLFGDSDTSARVPYALIGVISVGLMYVFRRWLGKTGAIFAAILMIISPYMLYYQRYVRNEAIVVLLALLMFWAVFRYFESRESKWLYLLAISLALHFAAKETAFIYVAELGLFLGIYLSWDLLRRSWGTRGRRAIFILGLVIATLGVVIAARGFLGGEAGGLENIFAPVEPLDPTATGVVEVGANLNPILVSGLLTTLVGLLIVAGVTLFTFRSRLRTEFPSLDILVILGTMTLPQVAAFPARILGFNPLDSQTSVFATETGIIVILFIAISVIIGVAWDWRRWIVAAGIFFGLFIVLFTSMFTNGNGLSSGLVRSLEYWLVQHGEKRGGQPWFYYLVIQIPIYEFLPALGTLLAASYGLRKVNFRVPGWLKELRQDEPAPETIEQELKLQETIFPVIPFLGYWAVSSLILFSFAGERMPWLTVHIALPMILLAGWAIGKSLEGVDFSALRSRETWLSLFFAAIFIFGLMRVAGSLFGTMRPFQGDDYLSLQATTSFLAIMVVTLAALLATLYNLRGVSLPRFVQNLGLVVLGIFLFLTTRTSFRAAYLNADLATEYLVYAHSAPGVKSILSQVEEFSRRTTDGLAVDVAYDNDVSWPFTWYLRNFTSTHYYGENPSRDLQSYPLVIAGNDNWSEVEKFLGNRFISSEYIRMWWPNQGYFKLDWKNVEAQYQSELATEDGAEPPKMPLIYYLKRVFTALQPFFTDPEARQAVWQIWLNRDFTDYGEQSSIDVSLENWSPSDSMRFYIRRDVAAMIWDVGTSAVALPEISFQDPYAESFLELPAITTIGEMGTVPGEFAAPRGIAAGSDGSVYVADSLNHRVVKLNHQGEEIAQWGSFGQSNDEGEAPLGAFFEPWGIGVAPDGSVYVADTWNHRIQHFTAEGEFLDSIGPNDEEGEIRIFWGPRAIAIDKEYRIFIADTGNHRIAIYNQSGEFIGEFGGQGFDLGQLFEPVGLAVDNSGRVYVADTWNHRVQVFEEANENIFSFVTQWPIDGWYGESLDNKPYLAVSSDGIVCVTDPEDYRVLCFTSEGEYLQGWGQYGVGLSELSLPSGITFAADGRIWVSDSANNRLSIFESGLQ